MLAAAYSFQPSRYSLRAMSASASGASKKRAFAASQRSFFSTRTAMVPRRIVSLMAATFSSAALSEKGTLSTFHGCPAGEIEAMAVFRRRTS